jgi:hypothetical protein
MKRENLWTVCIFAGVLGASLLPSVTSAHSHIEARVDDAAPKHQLFW